MNKIVLTYGLIAGLIVSAMLYLTFSDGTINLQHSEWAGYATMIVALSTIFIAVKSYRDKYLDGMISFGKAFLIGLYITLIASTLYVGSWMIISNTLAPNYMDDYYAEALAEVQASGMSEEEINAQIQSMEEFKEMYKKPLFKIGVTYSEILPVGLIISLICAAILKKKP